MSKKKNLRDWVDDGELDLSLSDLQEVPVRDIAALTKVTSLDLSNNRLTHFGKNFATSLNFLIKLDLSKNQISKLPDNFGELHLLKHLDLYSNQLNHLPLSFGLLKNLRWLDLKNNPLVPALAEIAGPCQDTQQCQNCAKKVVKVIADAKARLDEEERIQKLKQQQKEMAEKAAAKKEQQKNKKASKNEKKKNAENGLKNEDRGHHPTKRERNANKANLKSQPKKSSGSFLGRAIKQLFFMSLLTFIFLNILYVVEPEKYHELRIGAVGLVNRTVNALPQPVVETSKQVTDYVRPSAQLALNKVQHLVNETSNFLNTDERVKDHWATVRSGSLLVSEKAKEYLILFYQRVKVLTSELRQKYF